MGSKFRCCQWQQLRNFLMPVALCPSCPLRYINHHQIVSHHDIHVWAITDPSRNHDVQSPLMRPLPPVHLFPAFPPADTWSRRVFHSGSTTCPESDQSIVSERWFVGGGRASCCKGGRGRREVRGWRTWGGWSKAVVGTIETLEVPMRH
jgi:hypothetical protein